MANQTTIAAALQDKIDAKAALKTAIEAQNVPVGTVKLSDYAPKVSLIGKVQGSGQHLVTFYDFDGTTGFDLWGRMNEKDKQYISNIAERLVKR